MLSRAFYKEYSVHTRIQSRWVDIELLCCVFSFTAAIVFPYSMTYYGTLSASSPTFGRPNGNGSGYYYQTYTVTISLPGTYRFQSSGKMNCYGLFYDNTFDPLRPNANLFASDDSSAGRDHFDINVSLQAQKTYNLVVTTSAASMTGEFSIIASGPAQVILNKLPATDNSPPPRKGE